ncbi:MAG: hypothetical protein JRJ00_04205 [Deltaproteobacteria bacterium]|nr:hypothetical protein [Deltaproteobacteria bacterium]
MNEKRFFPASIVDDITYCTDRAYANLSLNYAWIFTLEGEVSTEVSQRALDDTLNFYPKARCILVNRYPSYKRWFRHCWQYTNTTGKDILEEVQCPSSHASSEEAVNYYINNHARFSIDLSYQVPLKVVLLRTSQRVFLFFIMHHAVADGLGCFFFIQKFIQCYEDIIYQRVQEPPNESNFDVISSPEVKFRWSNFSPRYLRPHFRHFSLMRTAPSLSLFPHETEGISGDFLATVRNLIPPQLEAIRNTTKRYKSTINDYLLASMFKTIKTWSQKWTDQSNRIYIMVPISLRSPEDHTLSNILSGVTVSLKPAQIGDKEEMLPLIREEINTMVNSNMPRTVINLSSLLKPLPIPLRIRIMKYSTPGIALSIVLSNMGVLSPNPAHRDEDGFDYMGPAQISNIHGMPPVGAWPMLFICTYNKRMIFNLSFLNSYFSSETGGRFLNSFLGEIIS